MKQKLAYPAYHILMQTFSAWSADRMGALGAALAFYSVLSIGPLLLLVIAVAGLVFGHDAASGHVFNEIRGLVGSEGAEAIQNIIANSRDEKNGLIATIVGIGTFIFAATAAFGQLQDALNIIWKTQASRPAFIRLLRKRLLSFELILGIGFLLTVSLVISAVISAFSVYVTGFVGEALLHGVNFLLSLGMTSLLFAMIYKILPDVPIEWRDVRIGALATALLFTIGKQLIGLYLGQQALGSTFGAAGSVLVVLFWVYYSAQILFFGAEFTKVQADFRKKGLMAEND